MLTHLGVHQFRCNIYQHADNRQKHGENNALRGNIINIVQSQRNVQNIYFVALLPDYYQRRRPPPPTGCVCKQQKKEPSLEGQHWEYALNFRLPYSTVHILQACRESSKTKTRKCLTGQILLTCRRRANALSDNPYFVAVLPDYYERRRPPPRKACPGNQKKEPSLEGQHCKHVLGTSDFHQFHCNVLLF